MITRSKIPNYISRHILLCCAFLTVRFGMFTMRYCLVCGMHCHLVLFFGGGGKGWLYFAEDRRGERWTFHLSGRRRYECRAEHTPGAREVKLVILGSNLDHDTIVAALEQCCEQPQPPGLSASSTTVPDDRVVALARIRDDNRFELCAPSECEGADNDTTLSERAVVLFRMTAERTFGVPLAEIEGRHGVKLDKVNAELQRRVNYSSGGGFLTTAVGPGGSTVLRYATGGSQKLDDIWHVVDTAAEVLLKTAFANVALCRCGW